MAGTNNYKCTWTMGMLGDGWEEVWYFQGQTPQAALAAMIAVTPARLDLLNPNVSIDQLKVSDEAILGDSLPNYDFVGQKSKLTALLTRTVKTASLLGRAFSVAAAGPGAKPFQYQRPVELSGLPADWIVYDAQGNPVIPPNAPGQLSKSFAAWVQKMMAAQFCLKVNDKSQAMPPIKGVYVNPNTAIGLQSQGNILLNVPGHGLTPQNAQGQQTTYRVKGAKFLRTFADPKGLGPLDQTGHSIINRVQAWQDITLAGTPPAFPVINGAPINATDWLQLAYSLPTSFGLLIYVGGGNVQQRINTYPQLAVIPGVNPGTFIGPIIAERFNSRDRGRRRFVQRGRSRKRVVSVVSL